MGQGAQRVAIVTGGLTGIGLAAAKALADQGHHVAIGSRQADNVHAIEKARALLGKDAHISRLDVALQASVDAFTTIVRHHFGAPTILVNAAGIYREAFFPEHSDHDWLDQIEINLNGPFRMIRALWGDMVEAKWGRIANVASTAGSVGAAGYAAYCASKAGVIGLSKSVGVEGAPHGINCISVSPTWVETPMMDNAVGRIAKDKGITAEAARDRLTHSNPQGRLVQPSEIANLIGFFCTDASLGLTNVDIQVNAGADW
ncbi:MAG: SDR family NAD(P)-dependent oxidoreductase [Rhodobacteraceae bacterium]|jgi:NAD(P)-dependent dehydrogenase (short-subunit alcohol dehydrogenase family)|nr:SDR family NAD(P)-dependent oxidoreductase [Paracoccaceae bacterium]